MFPVPIDALHGLDLHHLRTNAQDRRRSRCLSSVEGPPLWGDLHPLCDPNARAPASATSFFTKGLPGDARRLQEKIWWEEGEED